MVQDILRERREDEVWLARARIARAEASLAETMATSEMAAVQAALDKVVQARWALAQLEGKAAE